jgi:predicted thioesterase
MELAVGQAGQSTFETDESHSAVRYGNDGVDVIATPALVGLVEVACHRLMRPHFDADEASVGVHLDLAHEAAAPIGVTVQVSAEIVAIEGRKVTFAVVAQAEGTVLMRGRHLRALVDYERLRRSAAERFPGAQ